MTTKVTGDLYEKLDGRLFEIKRQIRQRDGYTFDPNALNNFLQRAIEGKFIETDAVWFEKDGVIYFTVTSNGKSGKEWIKHFESKGIKIGDYASKILLKIKPSKKGTVTQIAVIKGEFFSDHNRIMSNIRIEADKRKFEKLNAEVECLIRDMFTDEEIEKMGLSWIVIMHEPIKDSDGDSIFLYAGRLDDGSWLRTLQTRFDGRWLRKDGFAFASQQVTKISF